MKGCLFIQVAFSILVCFVRNNYLHSLNLNLKAMRSLFPMMSQRLHFSDALNRIQSYSQLIIYLAAIGVMAYGYIVLHGMLSSYLVGFELTQIPEY